MRPQRFRPRGACPPVRPAALALLVLAPALAGCAAPPSAPACAPAPVHAPTGAEPLRPAEALEFRTGDQVVLRGGWFPGDGSHAVVLVHGVNEDRHAWGRLLDALRPRGFTVLAFDLRGHGESTTRAGAPYHWRNFSQPDFDAMELDVLAALEVARGRLNPPCLAVVGASLGATLAVRAAAAKADLVDAMALLSPGPDYAGIDAMAPLEHATATPFLAAARGDLESYQTAQFMANRLGNETLHLVDGDAHGTNLLGTSVKDALVAWLAAHA